MKPTEVYRVRVARSAVGLGIYHGFILRPPERDIDPDADLSPEMMGDDGEPCIILSALEMPHVPGERGLTPDRSAQNYFNATLVRTNSDGVKVTMIDQVQDVAAPAVLMFRPSQGELC